MGGGTCCNKWQHGRREIAVRGLIGGELVAEVERESEGWGGGWGGVGGTKSSLPPSRESEHDDQPDHEGNLIQFKSLLWPECLRGGERHCSDAGNI